MEWAERAWTRFLFGSRLGPQQLNQIKSSSRRVCIIYLSIYLFIHLLIFICWLVARSIECCFIQFYSVCVCFVFLSLYHLLYLFSVFVRRGKQFWNIDFIISFFFGLLFSPDVRSSVFRSLSLFVFLSFWSVGRGFHFVFVYILDSVLSRDISIKRAHCLGTSKVQIDSYLDIKLGPNNNQQQQRWHHSGDEYDVWYWAF